MATLLEEEAQVEVLLQGLVSSMSQCEKLAMLMIGRELTMPGTIEQAVLDDPRRALGMKREVAL